MPSSSPPTAGKMEGHSFGITHVQINERDGQAISLSTAKVEELIISGN